MSMGDNVDGLIKVTAALLTARVEEVSTVDPVTTEAAVVINGIVVVVIVAVVGAIVAVTDI